MKKEKVLVALLVTAFLGLAQLAWAGIRDEFKDGFIEGYKSVAGGLAMVPPCPPAPPTPPGSTPFREGIKAGVRAANQAGSRGLGSSSANTLDEFRDGFIEGYRSIMGDWAMVPMIPMTPMTPMGSTPYREGIKAGIRAGYRRK